MKKTLLLIISTFLSFNTIFAQDIISKLGGTTTNNTFSDTSTAVDGTTATVIITPFLQSRTAGVSIDPPAYDTDSTQSGTNPVVANTDTAGNDTSTAGDGTDTTEYGPDSSGQFSDPDPTVIEGGISGSIPGLGEASTDTSMTAEADADSNGEGTDPPSDDPDDRHN